MKYKFFGKDNSIVYIESDEILITDSQSALDLMATVKYDTGSHKMIIDKKNICEEFFRLSSGIAGEILQKFVNYRTMLAVIGDFSVYTSKPLHDFIYECRKGNSIFFTDQLNLAVQKFQAV
jgi:hypothetical protein